MSRAHKSGLLVLVLVFLAAAAPVPEVESEAGNLKHNRQLLEKWKADEEHYARLRRDLREFWALPEAKRQRLRQLDKDLHELDAKTRKRLWKVAERYAAWLERLPEDQRRRIEATEDAKERLALIKEIRERQWIERLPRKVREELEQLPAEKRAARLAQLHEQERQQRKLWQQGGPRPKPPLRLIDLAPPARQFVQKHLLPHLTDEEKTQFIAATGHAEFPRLVKELVRRHPVLPPLPPPAKAVVRFKDLPERTKVEVGSEAVWEKRRDIWQRLREVEGAWPEWALLFQSHLTSAQRANLPPLGASRPSEFPRPIAVFIRNKLKPKLPPDEKRQLRNAEGRWPDYPKLLLHLAEKHKLEVPGMSLPALN